MIVLIAVVRGMTDFMKYRRVLHFGLAKFVIAAMAVYLAVATPVLAADAATAQDSDPFFHEIDAKFRRDYAQAKSEIRQALGPVILCDGHSMSLLKGKEKISLEFIKPRYTGLKEIAHINLDAFILLVNHTDEKLSEKILERLQEFKSDIEKSVLRLKENQGLEAGDISQQERVIQKSITFVEGVIANGRISADALQQFARSCSVLDLDNAYQAVGSQYKTMDTAIHKWRQEMTDQEWQNLHVIISTTHMPRNELASYQYFCKLLKQTREGKRIIVAEGFTQGSDEQLVDLLVTHILDGKIAVDFFNDPWRMHRDLLSDGARKYLSKHKLLSDRTN